MNNIRSVIQDSQKKHITQINNQSLYRQINIMEKRPHYSEATNDSF